jgi:hypothetical protein
MSYIVQDIVGGIELAVGILVEVGTLGGGSALAIPLIIAGSTTLLGGVIGSLLNKPQGETISSRDPNAPWRLVYGYTRLAGVVTFLGTHGNNNEYLDIVLTLAKGKVHAIGAPYFNGTAIPLDSNGNGEGQWQGYVHVETDVGDPANTNQPFPGLAAAQPGYWNNTCLQQGHAKAYVCLKWSTSLFANGCPNITFDIYGREVWDPRTSTKAFSSNPALCLRDYLLDQELGLQCDHSTVDGNGNVTYSDEINDAAVSAAANICDESVTLMGCIQTAVPSNGHAGHGFVAGDTVSVYGGNGGAVLWIAQVTSSGAVQKVNIVNPGATYSTASDVSCSGGHGSGLAVDITTENGTEAQYTCNGCFESTQTPEAIINDLCNAMAGFCPYFDGQFQPIAGAYTTPTVSLGDDDFRAPLDIQLTTSRRDLYNSVHGSYLSMANDWQSTDYPAVINGPYVDQDGVILWSQLDLPVTTSASMCQRIANIFLQRNRRQVTVNAKCKLTAGNIAPGDTIQLTHARFGWSNKTFFVQDVQFVIEKDIESGDKDESPALGVDLLLRETDSGVYTWTTAQEIAAMPTASAPTQAALEAMGMVVGPVTGLSALSDSTTAITGADGSVINRILLTWTPPADMYVQDGGHIIFWAVDTNDPFHSACPISYIVDGNASYFWLTPVTSGHSYTVTMWARNCKNIISAPAYLTGIIAGSCLGTGNNYQGNWSGSVSYSLNNEVYYNGNMYLSLINSNLGNEPDTHSSDWLLVGPLNLDSIADGTVNGKTKKAALTGGYVKQVSQDGSTLFNAKGVGDSQTLSLDSEIADGTTYGRVKLTCLTSNQVDLSLSGVQNRVLSNIADDSSYKKVAAADITSGHVLKTGSTGQYNVKGVGDSQTLSLETEIADTSNFVRQPAHVGAEGLVENGDFQSGSAGWSPYGSTISVDSSNYPYGSSGKSLKVITGQAWAGVSSLRSFTCIPGETYKIGAYIKSDGTNYAYALLAFLDGSGNNLGNLSCYSSSSSWSYKTATGTIPANTVYVVVDLETSAATTVWFSQVNAWRVRSLDDEVSDGNTYKRVLATALTSNQVDLSQSGVINKTLANISDATGRYAVTNAGSLNGVASVDSANLALINFASAHTNKTQDYLPDGTTYQRVKATELSSGTVKQVNDGTNTRTAAQITGVVDSTSSASQGEIIGGSKVTTVTKTALTLQQIHDSVSATTAGGYSASGLDNVSDGTTYKRVLATALASNIPTACQISAWVASTTYILGARVTYGSNTYTCISANSDSTWTVGHWQLDGPAALDNLADGTTYKRVLATALSGNIPTACQISAWVASTTYILGARVTYGSNTYTCISANSDSTWTAAHWQLDGPTTLDYLGDGSTYKRVLATALSSNIPTACQISAWVASTTYIVGAHVTYSNNTYICITANSDSTWTAGHWQLMGPATATNLSGAATQTSIQNSSYTYIADTSNTANDVVLALTPALTSYVAGLEITFKCANTNTGGVTVNVNGVGQATLYTEGPEGLQGLVAGALIAGGIYTAIYDGSYFQLQTFPSWVTSSVLSNILSGTLNNITCSGLTLENTILESGYGSFTPSADSTAAAKFVNAAGTTTLLNVDSTNKLVGILALEGLTKTQQADDTLYLGNGSYSNFFISGANSQSLSLILGYTNAKAAGTVSPFQVYNNATDASVLFQVASAGTSTGTNQILIDQNANAYVGIGGASSTSYTVNLTGTLNVTSTIYANGTAGTSAGKYTTITGITTVNGITTLLTGSSDERLKENVESLALGLDAIERITPRVYSWNEEGRKVSGSLKGERQAGFIAQEVQAVIPDAVKADDKGWLGIDERYVVGAMLNAIKELAAENRSLRARIEKLEAQLTAA